MNIVKLTGARPDTNLVLAQQVALACLAISGYKQAAANTDTDVFAAFRSQALGIQHETQDDEARVKLMEKFRDEVIAAINSEYLGDIARGYGLSRFDSGKLDKEGHTRQVAQAITSAKNYAQRIVRCWKAGVLVQDDWSAAKCSSKANNAEKERNKIANAGRVERPYESLQRETQQLTEVVKKAIGPDSKIDDPVKKVAADMMQNINRLIAAAANGMIGNDVLLSLADDVQTTFDASGLPTLAQAETTAVKAEDMPDVDAGSDESHRKVA